ncbi:MAG: T9SS type A sorting domain-containing protein [Bacteroidia bacterium]
MRTFNIFILLCCSLACFAQSSSTNYQSIVPGMFTHGALSQSTESKQQIVNMWNSGELQKSSYAQNHWFSYNNHDTSDLNSIPTLNTSFSLYPNPTNQFINITSIGEPISQISAINMQGIEVLNLNPESNFVEIDFENLPAGLYIILITVNNSQYIRRVIYQ